MFYNNFVDFAIHKFEKSHGQYYKSYDEFKAHFLSGDVTIPFTDMLNVVKLFNEQEGKDEIEQSAKNRLFAEGIFYSIRAMKGKAGEGTYMEIKDDGILNFYKPFGTEEYISSGLVWSACENMPLPELYNTMCKKIDEVIQGVIHVSQFQKGDSVIFTMNSNITGICEFNAKVTNVHFASGDRTNGSRVRYDLEIEFYGEEKTRMYSIDALFVKPKPVSLATSGATVTITGPLVMNGSGSITIKDPSKESVEVKN